MLTKLLSGWKYMGGAELKKYRFEMEWKGIHIPEKRDIKIGGRNVSKQPKVSRDSARKMLKEENL